MKLGLKYYAQYNTFSCWPVSLKMILEHLWIKESRESLIKKTKANDLVWTKNSNIIKVIEEYKLKYIEKENTKISELKQYIKRWYAPIVNYYNPITKVGHYSVINWFDDESKVFYFLDPRNGQDFTLWFKEFIDLWHNNKWDIKWWSLIVWREKIIL